MYSDSLATPTMQFLVKIVNRIASSAIVNVTKVSGYSGIYHPPLVSVQMSYVSDGKLLTLGILPIVPRYFICSYKITWLFLKRKKAHRVGKSNNRLAQSRNRFCRKPQLKEHVLVLYIFMQTKSIKNVVHVIIYVIRHPAPLFGICIYQRFEAIF